MAQWGRNDQAVTANSTTTKETSNGAPIGTWALVKGGTVSHTPNGHFGNTSSGSRASVDVAMFGNTTPGAFIPGKAVGVFGVDAYDGIKGSSGEGGEMDEGSGGIATAVITNPGSGYASGGGAVTLTITNGGSEGALAATVAAGKITAFSITAGEGYVTPPTVSIAAPAAVTFNGNSAVTTGNANITTAASARFAAGDKVTFSGNSLNTPAPLANGTYYISFANASVFALATTSSGANIALTKASGDSSTAAAASVTGETATASVTVGGAKNNGIPHAGWVLRTEGTGGRAGRVQYEVLVAMGSLGAQRAAYGTAATVADASDDDILPETVTR
jgi:hypothetical protein